MHKAGSQQVWRGDSVSCVCSSKQRSSGDDGKRRRTMANDGERWQTMENNRKQRIRSNHNRKNKKQQSTVGNCDSDDNSNLRNTVARVEKVATAWAAAAALTRGAMAKFYEEAINLRWLWWLDKIKVQRAEKMWQQNTGSSIVTTAMTAPAMEEQDLSINQQQ